MTLGFKTKFPWGEETLFPQKIMQSAYEGTVVFPGLGLLHSKKHTIRENQRFSGGEILHMATGVRTKNYHQFNKGIPGLEMCRSVQRFDLSYRDKDHIALYIGANLMYIKNGAKEKGLDFMKKFVVNDGFTGVEQFFKWFKRPVHNGQIIHWTNLLYGPEDTEATL